MPNKGYQFSNAKTFVNPYNFVPMGKGISRSSMETPQKELHTGVLSCRLIVKTPIFIPDASKMSTDSNGHNHYPFLRIGGKPVIPASSIRGPIRSAYEALTDSCFCTIKPDQIVSLRRTSREAMKPGLICCQDGKWKLYTAVRHKVDLAEFDNFLRKASYGDEVWFRSDQTTETIRGKTITTYTVTDILKNPAAQARRGSRQGYVYVGEAFGNKKYGSFFTKGTLVQELGENSEVIAKAVKQLELVLQEYADTDPSKLPERHTAYRNMRAAFPKLKRDGKWIPVWYIYNGEAAKEEDYRLHFSPACIGRYAYTNSVNDVIDHMGRYESCKNRRNACPACSLFGLIGKDANQEMSADEQNRSVDAAGEDAQEPAKQSAVGKNNDCDGSANRQNRVADAAGEDVREPEKQSVNEKGDLREKRAKGAASRVRFTDAVWDGTGRPTMKPVNLQELASPHPSYLWFYMENGAEYDATGARIRGRKFYWHHLPKPEFSETGELNNRNATMEKLESGEFLFSVYYDGITKKQLQELVWTLCAGENKVDSPMCHKIGHAKPFGYGSVKIVVETCLERIWDGEHYVIRELDLHSEMEEDLTEEDFHSEEETHTREDFSSEPDWHTRKDANSEPKPRLCYREAFAGDNKARQAMEIALNMDSIASGIPVRYPYVEDPNSRASNPNAIASHQWYSNNRAEGTDAQKLPGVSAKTKKMRHLNYIG